MDDKLQEDYGTLLKYGTFSTTNLARAQALVNLLKELNEDYHTEVSVPKGNSAASGVVVFLPRVSQ